MLHVMNAAEKRVVLRKIKLEVEVVVKASLTTQGKSEGKGWNYLDS